jgi:hypothetical protein
VDKMGPKGAQWSFHSDRGHISRQYGTKRGSAELPFRQGPRQWTKWEQKVLSGAAIQKGATAVDSMGLKGAQWNCHSDRGHTSGQNGTKMGSGGLPFRKGPRQ